MKKFKFKLIMERELFAEGETAEEARQFLIEKMANDEDERVFSCEGSDYLNDGVEHGE